MGPAWLHKGPLPRGRLLVSSWQKGPEEQFQASFTKRLILRMTLSPPKGPTFCHHHGIRSQHVNYRGTHSDHGSMYSCWKSGRFLSATSSHVLFSKAHPRTTLTFFCGFIHPNSAPLWVTGICVALWASGRHVRVRQRSLSLAYHENSPITDSCQCGIRNEEGRYWYTMAPYCSSNM